MIAAMSGPDTQLPTSLRAQARWQRLTSAGVPAMLVHPDWESATPVPVVLWMHGRTVDKELDPGRYLRWMRAGIAACAVDLPGHGERFDAALQEPDRTLDVVRQMLGEIDPIVDALGAMGLFDLDRAGIGGVSAGGMTALARLCTRHRFRCVSVEATTGSWRHQSHRPMFRDRGEEAGDLDPIEHLDGWREIPFQALHARHDEWVPIDGQQTFIDALRRQYRDPDRIEFIRYDRTGAAYEHAGFGRMASEAKNSQLDFLKRRLRPDA
ncbi:MAG: hypothetical protein E2O40_02105 [Planctomycetota bacterium]|nr:MAG: hypothetical protein E2O40_02105 [Planctomycetota bacterium]